MLMNSLLKVCFTLGLLIAGTALSAATPNVLFIAVDDLNDWIGCLGGHPQAKTPNFDRLAKSGVLFTNAYCAAASCNPSRTAIFSGRPPHRSGLYQNMQKMREVMPEAELLPRYFSRHGYWSAGSGKMLHYVIDPSSWDDYFPDKAKDDPFPHTFYPKQRPVNLPRAGDWQYVETDWAALEVSDEEFGGDWSVTRWIGEQLGRPHEKPFFLACGLYRPHEPWFVPKKYFEPFPLETIQTGPGVQEGDLDDVPPLGQKLGRNRYFAHIQAHGQWKKGIQAYLASIHFADAMLGRVLDALKAGGVENDTFVLFTSDNGCASYIGVKEMEKQGHYPSGPLRDYKTSVYEGGHRVPFVVKWPGVVKAGSVCKQLVLQADTMATLAEIFEVKLPDTAGEDSFSMMPLLKSEDRPIRTNAVNTACGGTPSFRDGPWKYVAHAEPELYNLDEDLGETMNVAPLHPDRVKAMQAAFEKLIRAGRSTPGAPQKNDIKVVRYPKAAEAPKAKKN